MTPRPQGARQLKSKQWSQEPWILVLPLQLSGLLPGTQFFHWYNERRGSFRDSQGMSSGATGGRGLTCCPHRVHGHSARPGLISRCPVGTSTAAVPGTLHNSAPGPSCGYIPGWSYLQGSGAPGRLFALGRNTCWADVGFPRPLGRQSQVRRPLAASPENRRGTKAQSAELCVMWVLARSLPTTPTLEPEKGAALPAPPEVGWCMGKALGLQRRPYRSFCVRRGGPRQWMVCLLGKEARSALAGSQI